MPSRQSPWLLPDPGRRAFRPGGLFVPILALASTLAIGCSGSPEARLPGQEEARRLQPLQGEAGAYLADPLDGYPFITEPQRAAETRKAFRELLAGEEPQGIRFAAAKVLEGDPGFHPASVLTAQSYLVEARSQEALQWLRPVLSEVPEYFPAQLAAGRAAELEDDPLEAFEAYSAVAAFSEAAERKARGIRPRALEILQGRFRDAIDRGRWEIAQASAERLEYWAPEDPETLDSALLLAEGRDDRPAALRVLRKIAAQRPSEPFYLLRQGQLEVEVGDASAGVALLRGLTHRYPEQAAYRESLERAEFRWRFSMLPREVKEVAGQQELSRSDFAAIIYWLVPGVRHGRGQGGRIATDILDHSQREPIARVINLGLMDVDERLHRFIPDRPVTRMEVLTGLLRFLEMQRSPVACLGAGGISKNPSIEAVCSAAASCRILLSAADCLPYAPVRGQEALELVRLSLKLTAES